MPAEASDFYPDDGSVVLDEPDVREQAARLPWADGALIIRPRLLRELRTWTDTSEAGVFVGDYVEVLPFPRVVDLATGSESVELVEVEDGDDEVVSLGQGFSLARLRIAFPVPAASGAQWRRLHLRATRQTVTTTTDEDGHISTTTDGAGETADFHVEHVEQHDTYNAATYDPSDPLTWPYFAVDGAAISAPTPPTPTANGLRTSASRAVQLVFTLPAEGVFWLASTVDAGTVRPGCIPGGFGWLGRRRAVRIHEGFTSLP